MNKTVKETIHAKGIDIGIYTTDFENEYISLTDIARYRSSDPRITIHTWLRGRDIVEFLGLWESLHNPDFKHSEFDTFIALEFDSWLSPEFKLYIIKDYKRLKSDENSRLSLNWNLNRELSKLNYKIHTDAIKENLIIPELTASQKSFVYSDEADLLNVALFEKTAKEWRKENSGKKGNIRDYTDLQHLLVLSNLESYNAILIKQKIDQSERLELLREAAINQLKTILDLDFSLQKILSISDTSGEEK